MKKCYLCPRECGANRFDGQKGFCGSDAQLVVSSYHAHFGEEACLVGRGGSGTVFLTHCSLRCVFCINWEISQGGHGTAVSVDDLAAMMLSLQAKGCHNVNLVTPTHYSPHILLAVDRAATKGLRVPLVWNTCGWEKVDILKTLDGVVDIYLPDFKYADGPMAPRWWGGLDPLDRTHISCDNYPRKPVGSMFFAFSERFGNSGQLETLSNIATA